MAVLTLQAKGSTGGDTIIESNDPTFNYGVSESLRAGINGAIIARSLLRFDLSTLPAGAVVSSAILTLRCVGQDSATPRAIAVTRGLTQWYEGSRNGAVPAENGSTYNQRNDFFNVNWGGSIAGGQSGVDYVASPSGGSVVIGTVGIDYSWTVTADVQLWASGTINNGWWLLGGTVDTDSRKHFSSLDASTPSQRPKLVITYTASVVIAPTARFAVAGRNGPTVVKGSMALAPAARSAVGSTVGPTINVGYTITPAPADSIGDAIRDDPSLGGETVLGAQASAVGTTVNPTVFKAGGPASVPPAQVVGDRVNPTPLKAGGPASIPPASAVGDLGGFASLVDRTLRPAAATAVGTTLGQATALRIYAELCGPMPLLFITDGSIKDNGQIDMLNLISRRAGFILNNWEPSVAQYKSGGTFSASPLSDGRRLVRRSFDNAIEVMELRVNGHSQDNAIQFSRELFGWQELAASYWVSDWADKPIYLVAKGPRETQIRYAIIYMMSCPQLANPYAQPFFSKNGRASVNTVTLRIERGDWKDSPPGEGLCVPVSGVRSWTIQGWQVSDTTGGGEDTVSGAVRAIVQANNGDILIGTDDQAKVFRSTDDGQNWLFLNKFAGVVSVADSVNAFVKDSSGNLYAAVTGSSTAQGIWKSTNNGVTWTRVKSHPSGTGYLDITAAQGNKLTAVGKAVASSAESPIVYSNNAGVTWTNVSTPSWNQDYIAAAAYPEPVLFTQYPQETYGNVFTFLGTGGFYTAQYGVGVSGGTPQLYGFGTLGGGAGNGGLDMASYLVQVDGKFYRKALWAVKSHLNIADTEIWQWPSGTYQSGSTQFSKIATITGKIFNVLYVDPALTWQSIGAQRTIWAGANGEIWVSYNNGFTWALVTTAPVGQIRSIARTSAGTLIAGGDSGEIFVYTGVGSEGGGIGDGISYGGGSIVVNSYPLGREATCEDEVYTANKSSFSNITHVLHYNGSTYSELQFATLPPYNILGTTPAVNKAVYFGSKTSDTNVPGGTFSGVVFSLTQIAQNITIVWEYWNGATWATLTVQDSSNGFRILGGGSVHWVIPATWATTSVNSVTGYWVRARISAVGASPVYPIHGSELRSRFIYTPNLPYIEVAEGEISGDLPAAAQVRWQNRGDDPTTAIDMEMDRLVCGLRSVSRGEYFNSYLNISDTQIPFGVSLTKHADGTWGASQRAATNRALTVSHSSGGQLNIWNDLVTFSIANTIARDYYGTYHAFVRVYKYGAGTNNWQIRLRTSFGTGGSKKDSRVAFPTLSADWEALDLGEVTIPTAQVSRLGANLGDQLKLTVQGYATSTGVGITLYDVVLIPVDEWAADTLSPEPSTSDIAKVKGGAVLDIDSVTNPKASIIVTNRTSGDLIVSRYQAINNGPAMLQVGVKQRMWFLAMSYENFWRASPELTGSVQVFKQQRYLGYRGTT